MVSPSATKINVCLVPIFQLSDLINKDLFDVKKSYSYTYKKWTWYYEVET